jgi:hypothetical protein
LGKTIEATNDLTDISKNILIDDRFDSSTTKNLNNNHYNNRLLMDFPFSSEKKNIGDHNNFNSIQHMGGDYSNFLSNNKPNRDLLDFYPPNSNRSELN